MLLDSCATIITTFSGCLYAAIYDNYMHETDFIYFSEETEAAIYC